VDPRGARADRGEASVIGKGRMRWAGLEYLKVPGCRTTFETADVIVGVDFTTGREILVFRRGAQKMIAVTGMSDRLRVLRISITAPRRAGIS
jgi:hypothetical protein